MVANEDTKGPTALGSKGLYMIGIMKYMNRFWNGKANFTGFSGLTYKLF